nr:MAG TPA: PhnA Zinc-Ribbon [Bacteriophage sp.]
MIRKQVTHLQQKKHMIRKPGEQFKCKNCGYEW